MKLYDEEELRKKNEKNKKMRNLILVSIIFTVVLIVLLMGLIYYLIYNPNKITISLNGNESVKIEEMIITKKDDDGNTIVYYPIRDISGIFGYGSNNGDYGKNVENTENCYIESENEVAIFKENSNLIYKIDKSNDNNSNNDYKYEEVKIDNLVIKEKDKLYVDTEGLKKAFNLYININKRTKKINITSLDSFITSAESTIKSNKLGKLDEKFSNRKALLDNMMVIESESGGKKGVLSFDKKEEVLGFQYDDLTYIPSKESFLIKKDEKFGIIGKDKIAKIRPQYDKLSLIDNDNGLYLAEDNGFFGVIDENQNLMIHFEYTKIGVDVANYSENDIKNGYVYFNSLIPAQRNDGKWVFYKINSTIDANGNKKVDCNLIQDIDFDKIGCLDNNNENRGIVSALMLIKDYNLVVVQKYGYYGFMDINGNRVLGLVYTNAYIETSSGVSNYYATDKDGNKINIIEELEKIGYNKTN